MKAVRIILALLALLASSRLNAQQYFGMNQVQYKHFNWRVIETEHYDVHYYPEEREGAMAGARIPLRGRSPESLANDVSATFLRAFHLRPGPGTPLVPLEP